MAFLSPILLFSHRTRLRIRPTRQFSGISAGGRLEAKSSRQDSAPSQYFPCVVSHGSEPNIDPDLEANVAESNRAAAATAPLRAADRGRVAQMLAGAHPNLAFDGV